jgi:hypothetical protein
VPAKYIGTTIELRHPTGIPRLIAALALHTLTLGMMQKTQLLTEEHVFQANHEL